MRISDWSSDVCSSDLEVGRLAAHLVERARPLGHAQAGLLPDLARQAVDEALALVDHTAGWRPVVRAVATPVLHQQEALVAHDERPTDDPVTHGYILARGGLARLGSTAALLPQDRKSTRLNSSP